MSPRVSDIPRTLLPAFALLQERRRCPAQTCAASGGLTATNALVPWLTIYRRAGQIESNYDETVDSFDDMNLKSELLRGGK